MLKFLLIALILQISLSQRVNPALLSKATKAGQTATTNTITNYTDVKQCSCDNYANVCELYCCCDTDCTDDLRASWNSSNICTNLPYIKHYGVCPTEEVLALLTTPRTQDSVKFRQYHTEMCIYYTDTPYMGYFFSEIPITSTITNLQKDFYSNANDRTAAITQYENSAPATYSKGVKLWSIFSHPGFASPQTYSKFIIPYPDPYGRCENSYSALFLENLELTTCKRIVDFNTHCAADTVLSRSYYTTLLKLQKGPADTAQVSINIYQVISSNSGTNADPNLLTGTPCTCENVVKYVKYYIIHDNFGKVTGVDAVLVLENVQSDTCSDIIHFEQGFSVDYITASSQIPKSGNPGYLVGYPVIIGLYNGAIANTVLRSDEGFWMQGIARDGSCLSSTTGSAYFPESIIKFGQNSTFSCYYPIADLAAFQARCPVNPNDMAIFSNLQGTDTIAVGKYGNSKVIYIKDWVPVETFKDQSLFTPSLDTTTNTCTSPSTERISIFYKRYGKSSLSQNYIFKVVRTFDEVKTVYQPNAPSNSFTYSQVVSFYDMTNYL